MKIFQGIVLSVAFLAAINSPAQHTAKKDVSYDLYLTQIAAAEAFYQLNLISTANQYLEAADEKYRNMEWPFLKAALDQSQLPIQKQKGNYFTDIQVSPDGKTVAVFSRKHIELWNPETFTRTNVLAGHEKPGYGIGFSPDEKYLFSGSYDQTFKLWNLDTNACTLTFNGFSVIVYSRKILPENKIFFSSPEGKIWYYRF